jgi:hypothetical protein
VGFEPTTSAKQISNLSIRMAAVVVSKTEPI